MTWTGWIAEVDRDRPQIGRIKGESWKDDWDHCANVVLYAPDGKRLGRVSPPEGGPITFEPACSMEGWRPIKKPDFPLLRHGIMEYWGPSLKFLDL